MSDQNHAEVIDVLKRTMERRSLKLTDVAERSGIPYRSLQNYFSRRTQMPVTVYLKLCGILGLDADYIDRERFNIDRAALKIALRETLGHLVPHYKVIAESVQAVDPHSMVRSTRTMLADLDTLATLVIGEYDLAREQALNQSLADDEAAPKVPQ